MNTVALLLLPALVFSVSPDTKLTLDNIVFTTSSRFIDYFNFAPDNFPTLTVARECQISTGHPSLVVSPYSDSNVPSDKNTISLGRVEFDLKNPTDWFSVSCKVRIALPQFNPQRDFDDYTLVYQASRDHNTQGGSTVLTTFIGHNQDWNLSATVSFSCSNPSASGFNCDCKDCGGQSVCCPDFNFVSPDSCECNHVSPTSPNNIFSTTPCPGEIEHENKEDLYFWIMIGLAILAAILLIFLIISMSYICCALRKQDRARVGDRTRESSAPVYLHTPPRDERHGYSRPPPPMPPPRTNDTFDDDFDSISDEFQEPDRTRGEAQV